MRIGLIVYGDLETMTGGFLYDRLSVRYLRERGDTVEVISVPWRRYGRSLIFKASFSFLPKLNDFSPGLVPEDELIHPSFFYSTIACDAPSQFPLLPWFIIFVAERKGFGLPAVASKEGGAAEIVTHGVNGCLVAPGDAETLSSHMRELAENRERLLEMSLAAHRTFVKHPTWADTGKVIYDFLHSFKI